MDDAIAKATAWLGDALDWLRTEALDSAGQPLVLAAAVAGIGWLVLLAMAVFATRQPDVDAGPATMELGPEPPAVVNLITSDWRLEEEAACATLLDLAARKMADIEEVGPELSLVRLRGVRGTLNSYEQQVYDYAASCAVDSVVATEALAKGQQKPAAWWKSFRNAVIEDARSRGLSQPRWTGPWLTLLRGGSFIPGGLTALAAWEWAAGGAVVVGCWALIAGINAERGTAAGAEAAGRWLGLRRQLRDNDRFETLPAASVTIWDRHLAYGAALDVAPAAVVSLPVGLPADDRRAWSTYGTGLWHLIRVRYPRRWGFLPGPPMLWSRSPWWIAWVAVAVSALALLAYPVIAGLDLIGVKVVDSEAGTINSEALDTAWARAQDLAPAIVAPIWLAAAALLVLALTDIGNRRVVEGQVVRLRRRSRGDDSNYEHRMAIDDGRARETKAWLLNPKLYATVTEGEVVKVSLGRIFQYPFRIEKVADAPAGYSAPRSAGQPVDSTGPESAPAPVLEPNPLGPDPNLA
ncbi:MAG: DUF2207 domain-containing protein [Sporichthyaceae bacterium]|nr:DUF2207 domain-containing protein [Sporichthyaceae bacterium]